MSSGSIEDARRWLIHADNTLPRRPNDRAFSYLNLANRLQYVFFLL